MSVATAVSGCWALLLGLGLIMLGNGLQGTLLGVRATLEGFPTTLTGIVMTGYFVGFLFGSMVVPRLVKNVGHTRVFAALASLASASVLLHAIWVNPTAWFGFRLLSGFCYAGLFVVVESWINDAATNETRGKLLSVYMVVVGVGVGLGQLLLNLADPRGMLLFLLTSILVSLALVPIALSVATAPPFQAPSRVRVQELYHTSPLGIVGAFGVGLAHSALFGMGAVYAQQLDFALPQISVFMAIALAGGVMLQWPIGWLSDTLDRRMVITGVTFIAAIAATTIALLPAPGGVLHYALVWLFGGTTMPMYSLCIAHTNDFLDRTQIVAASAPLVLVAGCGLSIGPMMASTLMSTQGPAGLFWWLASLHATIGIFALYRMTVRDAVPLDRQRIYAAVTSRGSPLGAALATRATREHQQEQDSGETALEQ